MATELQIIEPPVGVSVDIEVEDGAFILGDSPGLGIGVNEAAIDACTLRPTTAPFEGPSVRPERAGHRLSLVPEPRWRVAENQMTAS